MNLRRTLVPLTLTLAQTAFADDTSEPPVETIVVQGTRATFEVPPGAEVRPDMPKLNLKLPPYSLESRDYIWPSGLRMIFQADHSQPVVSVTTVYDRGSAADPVGKEGIAHFVEHLWFRSQHVDASDPTGQARLPKVWDILSDLGCDLNASTADDWTNYMSVCPSTSLPALLRLESLRMENAVEGVVPEVVDTERDVIRNELRMRYENDDFGNVLPYLFSKLYPEGHPYSRLGIGTHESLANCKLPDIQKFVDDHYVPTNTTIVVVGDFNLDDVPRLIAENFDESLLKDPKNPDAPLALLETPPVRIDRAVPAPEPPAPRDQSMGVFEANVEQPLVVLGWSIPGGYRGKDDNYRIAASIAGNYMYYYFDANDARVDTTAGVGCFLWESKVDSKVICAVPIKKSVDLEKFDPEQIAQKAADQLAFVWTPDYIPSGAVIEEGQKYMDIELDRARMQNLAAILRSMDLFATVGGGRATDIAHHAHFTGSAAYHSDAMNDTMQISREEIVAFAEEYLTRDRMVNVFLKPIPEDELIVDAAQGSDYVAAQDDALRSTIKPEEITKEVIKDYTITPRTDLIQEKTLPNGLRVVVLEHGEAPLVEAGLFVNGGTLTGTPLSLDITSEAIIDTLWDNWTPANRRIDPLRIAGDWGQDGGANWTYRYVQSASGNLDGGLWFLREAVEQMKVDMDGRVQWTKDWRGELKAAWKERDFWLSEAMERHIYGDSPTGRLQYGMLPWEEWDASADITGTQALSYMRGKYQPANATLVIVGNVDGEQALKLAEYYFQGWKAAPGVPVGKQPPLAPQAPIDATPEILVFDHPGRTQTNVQFGCPIDAGTADQDALRGILGDYLDERSWIILRENGGVTYGAYAYADGLTNGASGLYMGSLVQNSGVLLAIHAFEDLAKKAEAGEWDTDRIQVHKLNRGKKYVNRQQSVPQMRSRLMSPLIWRQPWSYVDNYSERLAAVSANDLTRAVKGCSDHSIITLDGPKDVLVPALEAAGVKFEVADYKQSRRDMLAKYDPKTYKKLIKAEAKKAEEDAEDAATEAPAAPPAP